MKSAFDDHLLEPYRVQREYLLARFSQDQAGFYRADAALRKRCGLMLTTQHENALLDQAREFADNDAFGQE